MSFLKNLFRPSGPQKAPDYSTYITAKCNRCGEIIKSRIDLRNDLTIDYGSSGKEISYFCRKVLVGEQRCYQQIEIELTFDAKKKIVQRQISGGAFVD